MSDEATTQVEVSEKVQQAFDIIETLTLKEASDLVKMMEDKLGVTAAAPMGGMMMAPAAGGGEAAEEATEFDVVLKSFGDQKIPVVKEVRKITGLGLKEAKEAVEGAPKTILEKVDKEKGEEVKKALEAAGATVEIKPAAD